MTCNCTERLNGRATGDVHLQGCPKFNVAQSIRENAKKARPPSDQEPWVVADDTGVRVTFRDEDAAWRYRSEYTNRLTNPTVTYEPETTARPVDGRPGATDSGASSEAAKPCASNGPDSPAASVPSPSQPDSDDFKPDLLEQIIDRYLEDYEMVGEAEDGRDARHVPTEGERILIKDALLGLLADDEWDAAWGALIQARVAHPTTAPAGVQEREAAPSLDGLAEWLREKAEDYDTQKKRDSILRWAVAVEGAALSSPAVAPVRMLTDERIAEIAAATFSSDEWDLDDKAHYAEWLALVARPLARAIIAEVAPAVAAPSAGTVDTSDGAGLDGRIYVSCYQCDNCQHIGINDEHPTESACNRCDWHGPSPSEDRCPGCGEVGTMSTACPECGSHYVLLADAHVAPHGVRGSGEGQQ